MSTIATARTYHCAFCPNPAIACLPAFAARHDGTLEPVCGECLITFWAELEAADDDYS
ncbi:hypothetical protein ACIA8C_36175 [Nocardia sp. NPDC051321]|uniref:hypothetical protein n=1 Tax=Nocardia sp. NPDC051321 TaxID=3364323 RepID=UPI0037AB07FF